MWLDSARLVLRNAANLSAAHRFELTEISSRWRRCARLVDMSGAKTFQRRGIVEDFFGPLWSMAHRRRLFAFGAARGMNPRCHPRCQIFTFIIHKSWVATDHN